MLNSPSHSQNNAVTLMCFALKRVQRYAFLAKHASKDAKNIENISCFELFCITLHHIFQ